MATSYMELNKQPPLPEVPISPNSYPKAIVS